MFMQITGYFKIMIRFVFGYIAFISFFGMAWLAPYINSINVFLYYVHIIILFVIAFNFIKAKNYNLYIAINIIGALLSSYLIYHSLTDTHNPFITHVITLSCFLFLLSTSKMKAA
jgi:hypothetical protein